MPPPLPRRRLSHASQDSSPRTPPNSNTPLPFLPVSSQKRYSSDSWNSSNYDGTEDLEAEWSPEQTRLLSRTLDALPAHLLTPFNGPVPPSNLLDKIARGVAEAKGPVSWPHSLRATRAKIVELARALAKETVNDGASDTIAEEEGSDTDEQQQTARVATKRPLYRQSSMDFMQVEARNWADNDNISRLSQRLQNADRFLSTSSFQSYAAPSSRSTSPFRAPGGQAFFPSTPSSTTLNSNHSSSRIPRLRRSMSDMSNSSDSFVMPAVDPRMQRIKRTESFAGSMLYGPGQGLKRAPSFGALSKRSSGAMSLSGRDSDATSSDEEEKLRSMKAKKARVKTASSASPPTSPVKSPEISRTRKPPKSSPAKTSRSSKDTPARRPAKPRANIQRNPSILGGELPQLQSSFEPPTPSRRTPRADRQTHHLSPKSPDAPAVESTVTATPASSKALRRTKGSKLPHCPVARKISFGSPGSPTEKSGSPSAGASLGSAFQMV
ncbi:uncharacterized protein B0H18DRAFT_1117957 [Fomitopsis serialis]|uniref:uncharacterized protein n=1 Tax=Fomitopsis serialis TaxID=139415 RepID=UPI002008A7A9|nr:uncharacterized protein B0H18DRAFT_1117957 [Neoantrodia serialis]KAH9928272.1 hypothetical protein B0H18DRAFT_1117957 [Neoantrodia serialis]